VDRVARAWTPLEWWRAHPWIAFGGSLFMTAAALIPVIVDGRSPIIAGIGGLLMLASFIRGVQLAARRTALQAVLAGGAAILAALVVFAAIVVPLYGGVQPRVRIAKATADIKSIVSAIKEYKEHTGSLPTDLAALNSTATNARGEAAGPFLPSTPHPPVHGTPPWTTYTYVHHPSGTFTVSATGDGTTITLP